MSLVEQAIAKLRQSAKVGTTEARHDMRGGAAGPIPHDNLEDTAQNIAMLNVDSAALRANGYLPEEGQERQFAEHYRQIKRPLVERALSGEVAVESPSARVIMVTSALPGEGKTFTSINLALSMALERDISVLLADADVLKPRVSEIFGVRQERGLMDALVNERLGIESLVIPTNVRGLSILPAGRAGENPAELLTSNRMRQLLTHLISHDPRRIVLLDSPPMLITSEGKLLTKIAGQIVLVVRAGQTPLHALREVIALCNSEQRVGIVVNDGRLTLTEEFYGYGTYGSQSNAHTDDR